MMCSETNLKLNIEIFDVHAMMMMLMMMMIEGKKMRNTAMMMT